jgi:translation elongation factor EF-Ts
MASVSPQLLSALRQRTQLPLKDCKEALLATNLNAEKALAWLQERCADRFSMSSTSGHTDMEVDSKLLAIAIPSDHRSASFAEVHCRTSFAANTDLLKGFLSDLACKPYSTPGQDSQSLPTITSQLKEPVHIAKTMQWVGSSPQSFFFAYCHPPMHASVQSNKVWMGRSFLLVQLLAPRADMSSLSELGTRVAQHCYAAIHSGQVTLETPDSQILSLPFLFQQTKSLGSLLSSNNLTLQRWTSSTVGKEHNERLFNQ